MEPALVDQPVVRQRVENAVEENPEPDPRPRFPRPCAHDHRAAGREHRYAESRASDREAVVLFQTMVVRFMMVAVPRPAEAGHDIFVARPKSEEHTSELQTLMRNSYTVFSLKK